MRISTSAFISLSRIFTPSATLCAFVCTLLLGGATSLAAQKVTATINLGCQPDSIAVNPSTNKIYVPCMIDYWGGNSTPTGAIIVIDGATNETTTIATSSYPYAVAVNPTTNKIYFANDDAKDGSITVLDGATNKGTIVPVNFATGSQSVPYNPSTIVVNPVNNKVYVASLGSGNMTLLDGATNGVTELQAGGTLPSIALNSSTNNVYVTDPPSKYIAMIDGKLDSVTPILIPSAFIVFAPSGAAINPVSNKAYWSYGLEQDAKTGALKIAMLVVDGATGATSDFAVPTSAQMGSGAPALLAFNSATNVLYGATYNGKAAAFNLAAGTTVPFSVGQETWAIAVNAAANTTYFANMNSNTVTIFDGTKNTASTLAVGNSPTCIAINTVTNTAYVTNYVDGTVSVIQGPVPVATTTTLTASANPQQLGSAVTFTAAVAAVSGSASPTGSVTFTVDGTSTAPVSLNGSGQATYQSSTLTAGTHSVLASYSGSTGFGPSSSSLSEVINVPQVALPTFSPAGGTYSSTQSVTIATTTAKAAIYYTTDGKTTPTTSSTKYTSALSVTSSETIQAIAAATGYANSPVSSSTYTLQAAAPAFSPAVGTFSSAQSVTLSDTTKSAAIYYTTDGSTPTTGSPKYATAIKVSRTTTINAIAAATGFNNSVVASGTYTINLPAAATPVFKPAGGTYSAAQSVTLTSATSGATIYYTTDGSTPSAANGTKYASAIAVKATETLNAIAIATNYNNSPVASATYTINLPTAAAPVFKPAGGTYTAAQSVTLTSATSGAAIYYTTDGSTPTSASTKYTGAIAVKATETINAIATATNYNNSAVASATYTLHLLQTITFAQPTSPVTYGAKAITLTATASSGLPVTLSLVSGPATLSGSALTITGAGTVVVAANQAGNAGYSAAAQLTRSITVNKAALAAAAAKLTMTYGASLPTLTYTLSGFVNGDIQALAVTGAPALTTTAKATSPVGSYPITIAAGTLAAANYSFQYTSAALTVSKATLTVTANNLSMKVGAAVPTLTYTMTGLVNGDTQAKATTGAPKLTTTATSKSTAGTYPITAAAGSLAAANYGFVYANGVLTVTP